MSENELSLMEQTLFNFDSYVALNMFEGMTYDQAVEQAKIDLKENE